MSKVIRFSNYIKRKVFHKLGLNFRENYFIDSFYSKINCQDLTIIGMHAEKENVFIPCSDASFSYKVYSFPDRYIYKLSNASIWLPDNLVYRQEGKLIAESSTLSVYRLLWEVPLPKFRAKRQQYGQCVYLPVNENYYHWILEDLPVFITALRAVPGAKIIVKNSKFKPALDFLEKFFPNNHYTIDCNVKCESLIMSAKTGGMGAPHDHGVVHPKDVCIVKEFFSDYMCQKSPPQKKVYVSRVGMRRSPQGEKDLVDRLKKEGFEIFDGNMGLFDQISYFQDVKLLVGSSGAALTNILWMQPNSSVVKISLYGERFHFFSDLAFYCGVDFENVDAAGNVWDSNQIEVILNQITLKRCE